VLFAFCFFNEVFFVCAYLNFYERTPIYASVVMQYISHVFEFQALAKILPDPVVAIFNFLGEVSWAQMIGAITFPIMVGKQIINVVQFWKASKIVSRYVP
jgi:CDP-diacylglycerol--inositol 3-phosphatidyltransferase